MQRILAWSGSFDALWTCYAPVERDVPNGKCARQVSIRVPEASDDDL